MTNGTEFLALYKNDIINSCVGTGLFPSVMFCQMVLEGSGNKTKLGRYGLSSLAYNYNNFGGIKAWGGYTGKVVEFKTAEQRADGSTYYVVAKFCHFDSVADFCKWRTVFLMKNPTYKRNGVFTAKTPYDQMVSLKKSGYATDVSYVNKLMDVYNTYGLTSLDAELKKKIVEVDKNRFTPIGKNFFNDLMNFLMPSADSTIVYRD